MPRDGRLRNPVFKICECCGREFMFRPHHHQEAESRRFCDRRCPTIRAAQVWLEVRREIAVPKEIFKPLRSLVAAVYAELGESEWRRIEAVAASARERIAA
jgi:hypothetical protein